MQVVVSVARDPVVPLKRMNPQIPIDLESVLMRCLAKRPEDRFANVIELRRALLSCRCASQWNFEQANIWWNEHAGHRLAQPGLADHSAAHTISTSTA